MSDHARAFQWRIAPRSTKGSEESLIQASAGELHKGTSIVRMSVMALPSDPELAQAAVNQLVNHRVKRQSRAHQEPPQVSTRDQVYIVFRSHSQDSHLHLNKHRRVPHGGGASLIPTFAYEPLMSQLPV